ncbi:NADH-quinone oxidoreductase subunit J [Marinobacter panjinensis]|uniref:NADH-quinone oxidoreductase subunit J n=1 Tax=Marinobacter panjinensis TaxID=2576384 RepID=A0A4U6QVN4_9GAMM|nr:NADH-quinone oxidoreductase subunit J [Marinobacter panjinensis]MCR8915056.1 NADH-quinone oxidoreductase subunit J [Marinobacter panjinensis]TKV64292.1 NADH-quinone oxidoreductase subunit J [Marinobacter panjinensis]
MELAFYLSGLVAILATVGVITGTHAVHAVVYLIVSLIAVALVFFALGAPFAGALEIIVYAGAIMVLFVFVVMMLNLGPDTEREQTLMHPRYWAGPSMLALVLLAALAALISQGVVGETIDGELLTARAVALTLFGPWLMVVELSAILLLAALVTASHVGRRSNAPGTSSRSTGGDS